MIITVNNSLQGFSRYTIALILFLVGLAYFLDTLNHGVAHTVVITLAISLFLYTLATLIPTAKATCPYKSAIIPIINAVCAGVMNVVHLLLSPGAAAKVPLRDI